MESYGLGMDDLFDDDHHHHHDISSSDDLDCLHVADDEQHSHNNEDENGANGAERREEDAGLDKEGDISKEVAERLKNIKAGAAKKRVLRPQPKLDPARLTGDRGIPILPKLFNEIKFKGKGHEEADLNKMMRTYEHWGHRLFPKMPFDEIVERIERLGQKRAVQAIVNKIRLDMPVLSDDFVITEANDEDHNQSNSDPNSPKRDADTLQTGDIDADYEDALDDMIEAEQNSVRSASQLVASTPHPNKQYNQQADMSPSTAQNVDITAEQLERMRRNQELAKQRRLQNAAEMKAKFAANMSASSAELNVSNPSQEEAMIVNPS